jgi:hypothetical protein
MQQAQSGNWAGAAPPRHSRNSHSEANEAPGLIDREDVEVEREIPSEENESVERSEGSEPPASDL